MGQLLRRLRSTFQREFLGYNKIQGQPFKVREIREKIEEILKG
jgi:hypothetical protein